jgi:hypothetical protein
VHMSTEIYPSQSFVPLKQNLYLISTNVYDNA